MGVVLGYKIGGDGTVLLTPRTLGSNSVRPESVRTQVNVVDHRTLPTTGLRTFSQHCGNRSALRRTMVPKETLEDVGGPAVDTFVHPSI